MATENFFDTAGDDILLLHELSDDITYRIIISIIDSAKGVSEISLENKLPLSSTYKRIKKLQKYGLIWIERIKIDASGKKSLLYRSKSEK
ncbi:MAG TPA: hypothetical protein VIP29_03475 [Nitrososphaeraceae archaeon]